MVSLRFSVRGPNVQGCMQCGRAACSVLFWIPGHPTRGPPLLAQLVKNLPIIEETLVRFLGREDLLEEGKATHSSILA